MTTRRERVVLDVESNVAATMVRDAAATALLKRELNSLSKTSVETSRSTDAMSKSNDGLEKSTKRSGSSINQLSGRLAIFLKLAGALGPALVPLTTAAVPALAGLTTQMGFAVVAAGTGVLAFQGVGDALKAMNEAHLVPTAANLEKARLAMEKISPAAQDFVRKLREMGPALREVRDSAAEGLMPGLTESLDNIDDLLPQVERIVGVIGAAMGEALSDGAASLAGPRWAAYFDFIEAEAQPTLTILAKSVGNLTHGLAEMWMAFDPLSDDFATGMLRASNTFDDWAQGLSQTEDFQEFIAYIQDTGPQVLDTLGAIGNMFLQIAEAAAPLGGPVLQVLETLADVIAEIADSPLGTPIMAAVTAMSALSLASGVFNRVGGQAWKTNISGANGYTAAMGAARRSMAVGAAGAGLLALSLTDVDEKAGLSNTAQLALMGTLISPGWGTAIGAGVGGLMDLTAAYGDLSGEIGRADAALQSNDLGALTSSLEELRAKQSELGFGAAGGIGSGLLNAASGDADKVANKAAMVDAAIWKLKASGENGAHTFNQILAPALGTTARALDIASASTEDFRQQFETLNAALSGRSSWREYHAAIDAATAALKENGKTLDRGTEKGRTNEAALDAIAATSLRVAENLRGMGRVRFLQRAREDFIAAAIAFGKTRAQAEALADKLELLDRADPIKPKIDDKDIRKAIRSGNDLLDKLLNIGLRPPAKPKVDKKPIDAAKGSADSLLGSLGLIDGYHATATVSIKKIGTAVFGGGSILSPADGTTVPGPRFPYRDRVPALLAPTEEVISNRHGQADRWRPLLKAINANAMADGGTAMAAQMNTYWRNPSSSAQGSGPSTQTIREAIDYRRLGREIADAVREGAPLVRLPDAGRGAYLSGADL